MAASSGRYPSRAGEKLAAALDTFAIDVRDAVCADFGCNVGGFTACLLDRGAQRVHAIDTGYGALAWTLRKDPRVNVLERTNALHCEVAETVDVVTIDVAWTPQRLAVPAAMRWLKASTGGSLPGIISLLKPHYELAKLTGQRSRDPLTDAEADAVCQQVCDELTHLGATVAGVCRTGLKGKGGNEEFLLHLLPRPRGG
jgi:23S rRNA (cytidine1920-2'-O)/16S rRNA (cytidine1409-2'-O)-methyltransferase